MAICSDVDLLPKIGSKVTEIILENDNIATIKFEDGSSIVTHTFPANVKASDKIKEYRWIKEMETTKTKYGISIMEDKK